MTTMLTAEMSHGSSPCADLSRHRDDRYVDAILDLQQTLSFGRLAAALSEVPDAYVANHGHGMTTVAARTGDLPYRYRLGIAGFRLAQYLRVGYASSQVVVHGALFGERICDWGPEDVHFLTLDDRTGKILGYVALVGNGDTSPRALSDARRGRYPVEQAHRIDLFDIVGTPDDLTTHDVREIKRFVHLRSMQDRERRLRVSLTLLLALTRVIETAYPLTKALVGDAEAHVALRHLLLMGLNVIVVAGTTPRLPDSDLMHPMYVTRATVAPFFARIPALAEVSRRAAMVEKACASTRLLESAGGLMRAMSGTVRTVSVEGVRS
jgi:hypothetical protein